MMFFLSYLLFGIIVIILIWKQYLVTWSNLNCCLWESISASCKLNFQESVYPSIIDGVLTKHLVSSFCILLGSVRNFLHQSDQERWKDFKVWGIPETKHSWTFLFQVVVLKPFWTSWGWRSRFFNLIGNCIDTDLLCWTFKNYFNQLFFISYIVRTSFNKSYKWSSFIQFIVR